MTTIKVDKITPGSGTTTTLGDSGDTFTIPAGVTFANSGSTNMGDQVTYCSTTKSASFTAVANKGYFINTSDASPFLNYAVTVASGTLYVTGGTGNVFYLDGSRTMAITLLKGRTYRFTQSDSSNDGHPLFISTSNSTNTSTVTAAIVSSGVSYYLDGASTQSAYVNTTSFNAATTRYIEFQPQTTGTFYFACYIHGIGMGGAITSQELTVTLPSSPTVGTEMIIIDSTGEASTNRIKIGRGGSKIKGLCTDGILDTDRVGVRLIYSDANQGWVTVTSANETPPVVTQALFVTATGGTITTSGDYKIHTFNSDANFVVSCAGNPSGSTQVDYVVVAGGGGGGTGTNNTGMGGAGAGGFRESSGTASGSYTASPLGACVSAITVSATSYPISVGAGGTVTSWPGKAAGGSGSNSTFSSITSAGGGGGSAQCQPALAGGSGGGGESFTASRAGASGNTPPVSPPQGNNGGEASPTSPAFGGGAGGGATAVGGNGSNPAGGTGGAGATTSITGSALAYAGGGGGGVGVTPVTGTGGNGGSCVGGRGAYASNPAGAGTTNRGGGGGGGYGLAPGTGTGLAGGTGGSGVVIIRYKYQ